MPDLYLGFMDEEVNEVLNQLVKQGMEQNRPVIVLERASPESGRLFERDLSSYGLAPQETYALTPQNVKSVAYLDDHTAFDDIYAPLDPSKPFDPDPSKPLENLAIALQRNLKKSDFVSQLRTEGNPSTPKKTNPDQPYLSVTQMIDPGATGKKLDWENPIILARGPEMGLQPNLTRTYLDAITRSLNDARTDMGGGEIGMNVAVLAAGGSVNENLQPGSVSDIEGSFFTGIEYDDKVKGMRPRIAFISDKTINESVQRSMEKQFSLGEQRDYEDIPARRVLWEGPQFKKFIDPKDGKTDLAPSRADRTAQMLFAAALENRDLTEEQLATLTEFCNGQSFTAEDLADQIPEIRSKIEEMEPYLPNNMEHVSITVSSIGGSDIKAAANTWGFSDVAMEDHHSLMAIANLKEPFNGHADLLNWKMQRIHCDPYSIGGEVLEEFGEFQQRDQSTDYYKQAILWGLQGSPKDKIPPQGDWSLARNLLRQQEDPQAYKDSYFYEAETTSTGNHDNGKRIVDPFFGEIAVDFLDQLSNPKWKEKEGAFGPGEVDDEVRGELQKRAAALRKLGKKATPEQVQEFVEYFRDNAGFQGKDETSMQVWTRPGKWKTLDGGKNLTTKLGDIDFVDEETGNADRALYKSVNRMKLEDYASEFVPKTQKTFNVVREQRRQLLREQAREHARQERLAQYNESSPLLSEPQKGYGTFDEPSKSKKEPKKKSMGYGTFDT